MSVKSVFCFYTHNSYTIHNKTTKTIPQGVCSNISTLRPTHIRDHLPFTQRLQKGTEGALISIKGIAKPTWGGYATERLARGEKWSKTDQMGVT